jgi:Flp pilus assembly protein TadG
MSTPSTRTGRGAQDTHRLGQAMVEFALVAPMFLLLLFSIIDFGRAVYYIQALNNAAREGARYAIVHGGNSLQPSGPMPPEIPIVPNPYDPNGTQVVQTVKGYAVGVIDASPADFAVAVSWCSQATVPNCPDDAVAPAGNGTNQRGDTVVVNVTYTFRPFISGIVPLPTFTLTGGSTLVINN